MGNFFLIHKLQTCGSREIGTFSDFEGLVLRGFGQDLLQYTNYTQIDINNKMAVYNSFILNPANVS